MPQVAWTQLHIHKPVGGFLRVHWSLWEMVQPTHKAWHGVSWSSWLLWQVSSALSTHIWSLPLLGVHRDMIQVNKIFPHMANIPKCHFVQSKCCKRLTDMERDFLPLCSLHRVKVPWTKALPKPSLVPQGFLVVKITFLCKATSSLSSPDRRGREHLLTLSALGSWSTLLLSVHLETQFSGEAGIEKVMGIAWSQMCISHRGAHRPRLLCLPLP